MSGNSRLFRWTRESSSKRTEFFVIQKERREPRSNPLLPSFFPLFSVYGTSAPVRKGERRLSFLRAFSGVFDGECSGKGRFFVEKSPALPVRKMAGAFREVQRAEITVKESVASILS